jgi:tartrate-resistant acid phosphatase type 5
MSSVPARIALTVLFIFIGSFAALAEAERLDFFVIGDWGVRGASNQVAVADAMAARAQTRRPRFIISTGDNFYQNGVASTTDSHWTQSFVNVYNQQALQRINWFVVLGNHDYQGSPQAQIDYSEVENRWNLPRRYYKRSFEVGQLKADLFFIDTSPYIPSYHSSSLMAANFISGQEERQKTWLQRGLQRSTADWQIVVGHHPLYSGSPTHQSDQPYMRENFLEIFEQYGVDLYLAGHDHDLQLLKAPSERTYHIVSGGGGGFRATNPHPYHEFAEATAGFVALQLSESSFRARFINQDGTVLSSQLRRRSE